jgi:hypothetical protein
MSSTHTIRPTGPRTGLVADRQALRLAAALLVSSYLVYVVATVFHPSGSRLKWPELESSPDT